MKEEETILVNLEGGMFQVKGGLEGDEVTQQLPPTHISFLTVSKLSKLSIFLGSEVERPRIKMFSKIENQLCLIFGHTYRLKRVLKHI